MADSIKFTIGGQLGPSYRGALSQAVAEAKAVNGQIARSLRVDLAKTNIALEKAPQGSAEASALFIMQQSLIRRLNILYANAAKQRMAEQQAEVAAVAAASAEKEELNRIALQKIVAEERAAGIALQAEQDAEVAAVAAAEAAKAAIRKKGLLEKLVLGRSRHSDAAQAYLDEAAAAQKAGFSIGRMGQEIRAEHGAVVNFRRGMSELTVIVRELAAGRGFARVFSSGMLAAQFFGVAVTKALFSIPGLVAAAAIAVGYVLVKSWHAAKEAAEDFKQHMSRANDVFRDGADALEEHHQAMLKNIAAAKEFDEWLTKLGKTEETATDMLEERIKAMREEFELRKQIAQNNGASPSEIRKMEQQQRKSELGEEEKVLKALKEEAAKEKQAAIDANKNAETHRASLDDKKGKKDFEKTIEAVEYFNSRIPQEVKDKIAANEKTIANYNAKEAAGEDITGKDLMVMSRAKEENDKLYKTEYGKQSLVGIGDGKAMVSPDQVQGIYQQALGHRARFLQEQEKLAKDQATLDEVKKSRQDNAMQKAKEVERLEKKVNEDKAAIALHDKYDSKLGDGKHPGKVTENDWERAGIFQGGTQIKLHDTLKESLKVQRQIAHNTAHHGGKGSDFNAGDGPGRI